LSSKIPSDRASLERYIQDLKSEVSQLQASAESLKAAYAKAISEGNADSALDHKRQLESLPVKVEILGVKISAAEAKLAVLRSNEPKALEIQKRIMQNWDEVKACLASLDSLGEKMRQDFENLQRLEKSTTSLGHEFASLVGVDPVHCYPRIIFCQRSDLPKLLDPYSERRPSLSRWIVEYPWSPWTYRPPQPE